MTGTVVIGYDGSEDASAAIRRAGALLAPRPAVVVHVWEGLVSLMLHSDSESLFGPLKAAAAELDADDAERAEAIVTGGAQLARDVGFEADPRAVHGKPKAWPALLDVADEVDAAAIVVGSRGLGGVQSALAGSVSSGVINHAKRPVLVVPPGEQRADGPLVIGYDGSDHAGAALAAAGMLFPGREALVHSVWISYRQVAPAGAAGAPAPLLSSAAQRIDADLAAAAGRTAEEGCRLAGEAGLSARGEALEAYGPVWRTLVRAADEAGAAAVVVGSHGRGAIGAAILGSTSRSVVHHAGVPVLVVPPRD